MAKKNYDSKLDQKTLLLENFLFRYNYVTIIKKILFLLLLFSTFSFARYINKCEILKVGTENYQIECKSLESKKTFLFDTVNLEIAKEYFEYPVIGKIYKVWFHEDDNGDYYYEKHMLAK